MRKCIIAALFVFVKKPSGVANTVVVGNNEYPQRIFKSMGSFSAWDLTNKRNAKLLCSWYCINFPSDGFKETFFYCTPCFSNFASVVGQKNMQMKHIQVD